MCFEHGEITPYRTTSQDLVPKFFSPIRTASAPPLREDTIGLKVPPKRETLWKMHANASRVSATCRISHFPWPGIPILGPRLLAHAVAACVLRSVETPGMKIKETEKHMAKAVQVFTLRHTINHITTRQRRQKARRYSKSSFYRTAFTYAPLD